MSIKNQKTLPQVLETLGDAMHNWAKKNQNDKHIGFEIGPTIDDFVRIVVFSDFYHKQPIENIIQELPQCVLDHGKSTILLVNKSQVMQYL